MLWIPVRGVPISLAIYQDNASSMEYFAIVPILAFLIVIHELGHFFAARSVGVKVEEFGIGLPPRVKGWKRNGVLWSLNALPIGGFVRVKGEDANDRDPGSLHNVSAWARGWFLLAGPLMNLAAAVVISILLVATTGMQISRPFINSVENESPAQMAGWQPGDRIVSINGESIDSTTQAIDIVNANKGDQTIVVIQRGGETIETNLTPRENPPEGQGSTGITFGDARFSDVQVDEIRSGTAAAQAGLQPGDKIVSINGVEIEAMQQASMMLNAHMGQEITLTYERESEQKTVTLELPAGTLLVAEVSSDTTASRAELYASDEITHVNGEPIASGDAFITTLVENSGGEVELDYVRTTGDGRVEMSTMLSVPNIAELDRTQVTANMGFSLLQTSGFHQLGVEPIGYVTHESVPMNRVVQEGWGQFTGLIGGTIDALRTTFSGNAPLESFVGPIGMSQMTGELINSADGNVVPVLLQLTMLISISLGLFNLLPIPALDGGRLVFVIIEILRGGKRVPPEKEGAVHMVGMLLLLGLIFFIAFGDVSRIINGESIFP